MTLAKSGIRLARALPCRPSHGREFGDSICWPTRDLRQDIEQVIPRVDGQPFAGRQHRTDRRDPRTGFLAADVQPVLATECHRPHRVFTPVMPPPDLCRVVKLEAHIPGVPDVIEFQRAA